jgi:iron complex transport system substrate-binding protein
VRIVSLLPAATEIVAALGAGSWLVGVSHECDYPPDIVRGLPRVTRTTIDGSQSSGAIDRAVRAAGAEATSIDAALLAELRPDVIVGQTVCDVCAVGGDALTRALADWPSRPHIVNLHAHTLDGVLRDMLSVGDALDLRGEAEELVAGLRYRLHRVQAGHTSHPTFPSPRILVVEWLDPPYVAGHWVPELIAIAGGRDVGNTPGARSVTRSWAELVALDPDRVIVALCGFDVARAQRETGAVADVDARRLFARGVEFLDGNAYTSRPGPRLVDAAERLALMLG